MKILPFLFCAGLAAAQALTCGNAINCGAIDANASQQTGMVFKWGIDHNGDGNSDTGVATATKAGDTLVCMCTAQNSGDCSPLVADSGQSWSRTNATPGTAFRWPTDVFYIVNAQIQNNITVTGTVIGCAEYPPATAIDQVIAQGFAAVPCGTPCSWNTGSVTTTAAKETLSTMCINETSAITTYAAGSGWTGGLISTDDANFFEESQAVTSTGTFSGTGTNTRTGGVNANTQLACIMTTWKTSIPGGIVLGGAVRYR